jgi:hypothetical protein
MNDINEMTSFIEGHNLNRDLRMEISRVLLTPNEESYEASQILVKVYEDDSANDRKDGSQLHESRWMQLAKTVDFTVIYGAEVNAVRGDVVLKEYYGGYLGSRNGVRRHINSGGCLEDGRGKHLSNTMRAKSKMLASVISSVLDTVTPQT